jgi:protein-tyrosine phosphatase
MRYIKTLDADSESRTPIFFCTHFTLLKKAVCAPYSPQHPLIVFHHKRNFMATPTVEIWQNWEEVTDKIQPCFRGRRLFRASCPNYDGHDDASQSLTQDAVNILIVRKVTRIVSFNHVPYNPDEMARLAAANILYLHLPVEDFHAATLDQLRLAIAFVHEGFLANTLIHCGFGWGRTGTGVSAIQMFATWGNLPESFWKIGGTNHVEKQVQVDALTAVQTRYSASG